MPKILDNVRADIIQATREVLSQQGYKKLNIRTIAARCGIATGTFYNYFQSKQDVLSTMMAEQWSDMKRRIEAAMDAEQSPMQRLCTIFDELRQTVVNAHSIWVEGVPAYLQDCSMAKAQALKKQMRTEIRGYIHRALVQSVPAERLPVVSELISRIFFSYANDRDIQFDELWDSMERLIR